MFLSCVFSFFSVRIQHQVHQNNIVAYFTYLAERYNKLLVAFKQPPKLWRARYYYGAYRARAAVYLHIAHCAQPRPVTKVYHLLALKLTKADISQTHHPIQKLMLKHGGIKHKSYPGDGGCS